MREIFWNSDYELENHLLLVSKININFPHSDSPSDLDANYHLKTFLKCRNHQSVEKSNMSFSVHNNDPKLTQEKTRPQRI